MESRLAEQLTRISEQLKSTREQAGIELEQVASETFIPLRLLKAMDEGKFERLPEPVFVQGFIRRYGDAVGLDGKNLSQEFTVQPPVLKKPASEFLSYHPEDEPAAAPRNNRTASKMKVPDPLPAELESQATQAVEATPQEVSPPVETSTSKPDTDPPVSVPVEAGDTPDSTKIETTAAADSSPEVAVTETPTASVSGESALESPAASLSTDNVVQEAASSDASTLGEATGDNASPTVPVSASSESTSSAAPSTTDVSNQREPIVVERTPKPPETEAPAETAATTTTPAKTEEYWSPSPLGNSTPSTTDNNKLIYWIGGISALALLTIGAIFLAQPKPSGNNPSTQTSSNQSSSSKPESPKPTPSTSPSPAAKTDAPITLSIKVSADSWVEVATDGKVVLSEVLPPGTSKTWTAKERLSITSGNAKGVTFSYNQSADKPMGPAANPVTLVFPPQE